MSTNKTQNYQLHSWVAGDKFLREEINENFSKLDLKSVQVLFGSYIGDGETTRTILLEKTPKVVLLCQSNGVFSSSYSMYGGMALDGLPALCGKGNTQTILAIVEGGFQVAVNSSLSPSVYTNRVDYVYHYLALY